MPGRARLRRLAFPVLGVALVAALVYLVWVVRARARRHHGGPGQAQRGEPRDVAFPGPDPAAPAAPPRASAPPGQADAQPEIAPPVPPPPNRVPLAEIVDAVEERVRVAVDACPLRPGHPDERVTFRYRVFVGKGRVGVDEVKEIESTLTDHALQDCLAQSLLDTGWMIDSADGFETVVDRPFVLGDLMRERGMELPAPGDYPAPIRKPSPGPPRPPGVPESK